MPSYETTIAIIGIGLIGGSLALSLKKYSSAYQILGVDHSAQTCHTAIELGAIDAAVTLEQAIKQSEILILCTPVSQTGSILQACLPYLKKNIIITDVGSTKLNVIAAARAILGENSSQFIPAHPIAGREFNGITAALPNLFNNKKTILCPLTENRSEDLSKIQTLWESVGASCYILSPEQHDTIFATVSHLPHLLAYTYIAQIANTDNMQTILDFAGSGFRDFTRIAASSPEIWKDIFIANRTALLHEIDTYQTLLTKIKSMIEQPQIDHLTHVLTNAAQIRQTWHKKHQND